MKQAGCFCGALFRVNYENELVEILQLHSRRVHLKEMSGDDAKRRIREIPMIDIETGALK